MRPEGRGRVMVSIRSMEREQIHVKIGATRLPLVGGPAFVVREGPKGERV
jgi:hypothetical protein